MIRRFALLAAIGSLAQAVSLSEFTVRRAKLREGLEGASAVLYGRTEKEAEDDRNGFFQEPNFFYLTGVAVPGAALLLAPDGDYLYLPRRSARTDLWHGRRLSFEDDAAKATGISARPIESLEADLRALDERKPLTVSDSALAAAIARLRMKKSPAELELIRRAIDAGIAAHRASWLAVEPGRFEYEVGARLVAAYASLGCRRNAFPPVIGSGPNGLVLHYSQNDRRMDAGELVLMDAGPECGLYVSDITRTVPVNGKFTARQRELYEAVLEAQRAVIAAAKPGVMLTALKQVAIDSLNARDRNLGRYLPHGVSHHVGLQAHDAADKDLPLAEGAVITVEPGVYVPEENIGIRIEDMLLITSEGAQLLTAALPSDPDAIEQAMSRLKK